MYHSSSIRWGAWGVAAWAALFLLLVGIRPGVALGNESSKTGKPERAQQQMEDFGAGPSPSVGAVTKGSQRSVRTADAREVPGDLTGIGLWIGGILPGGQDYGNTSGGMGFDLLYWFERPHFAVQPRVGIHFDTDRSDHTFWEVPLDVGLFWLPAAGPVTPYFGGGGGLRYIHEQRPVFLRTGTFLITEAVGFDRDSGLGVTVYGRFGFLLARRSSFRVNLNVDYAVTFLDLNGRGSPTCMAFGAGFVF
ncbi:MAG: hypothetical protein JW797_19155 [Bradymonadales bacterium]|nr:hypothetical protein [Bradymonadales bacterium]